MSEAFSAIPAVFMGLLVGILFLCVLGFLLQWLWNTTLPDIMNVKRITLVQAIKLMFLSALLFGGYRVVGWDHMTSGKPATAVVYRPA